MEPEYPIKELESKKSQEMSDWVSIQQDLILVIESISELLKQFPNRTEKMGTNSNITQQSLWVSALIYYARCFSGGVRTSLDSKVLYDGLSGDPMGVHEYYINLRNKQVAHSVNAFEKTKVGLIIPNENDTKPVKGLVYLSMRHVFSDKADCKQFQMLAQEALKYTNQQIKKLEKKIIEDVNMNCSVENLRKMKKLKHVAPGPNQAGVSRGDILL